MFTSIREKQPESRSVFKRSASMKDGANIAETSRISPAQCSHEWLSFLKCVLHFHTVDYCLSCLSIVFAVAEPWQTAELHMLVLFAFLPAFDMGKVERDRGGADTENFRALRTITWRNVSFCQKFSTPHLLSSPGDILPSTPPSPMSNLPTVLWNFATSNYLAVFVRQCVSIPCLLICDRKLRNSK
jgi:hypothetical protein